MLIDRERRRLHDEDVRTANVLEQLKMNLAVGESLQPGLAQWHTDELADLLGQGLIGRSAKNLDALIICQPAGALFFRGRLVRSRCFWLPVQNSVGGERRCSLRDCFCLFRLP